MLSNAVIRFMTDLSNSNFRPEIEISFLMVKKADLIILILKYYDIQVEFGLRLGSISKVYSCNLPEK